MPKSDWLNTYMIVIVTCTLNWSLSSVRVHPFLIISLFTETDYYGHRLIETVISHVAIKNWVQRAQKLLGWTLHTLTYLWQTRLFLFFIFYFGISSLYPTALLIIFFISSKYDDMKYVWYRLLKCSRDFSMSLRVKRQYDVNVKMFDCVSGLPS